MTNEPDVGEVRAALAEALLEIQLGSVLGGIGDWSSTRFFGVWGSGFCVLGFCICGVGFGGLGFGII